MKDTCIGVMREEVLMQDGFVCKGCDGKCGNCSLLSHTLEPAVYFRLEETRHPMRRMTLGHLRKRSQRDPTEREHRRDLCAQCPCCNVGETDAIRRKCLAYTATLPEKGSERFEAARAGRYDEWLAAKKKRKATAKAARAGKKVWAENRGFTTNFVQKKGKKKPGSSKWAHFPIRPAGT